MSINPLRRAASMLMKRDHGFSLPPLEEEGQSRRPAPAMVSSPASSIASTTLSILRHLKTPGPPSRMGTSMGLSRAGSTVPPSRIGSAVSTKSQATV